MSTVLVTGAGRGIGAALVRALLARGDRVIATVRNKAAVPADWTAAQAAGRLMVLAMDVANTMSVRGAASAVHEPVDVLINNAGMIGPARQSTLDMDFDGFAATLDVNTLGPLRVVQAFLPALRRGTTPRIITVSSRMGSLSHATSDRIAYRASKAAVNKVMQALATDLRREGIAVCVMHPGWVRTDMGGAGADITPEQSAAGILAVVDGLGIDGSGRFVNWDGSGLPW